LAACAVGKSHVTILIPTARECASNGRRGDDIVSLLDKSAAEFVPDARARILDTAVENWRMKQNALVAGVGMTRFGKHLNRSLCSLAHEAILAALADAGVSPADIQAAWSGNAGAALVTGQVCIAGQAILRGLGIGGIPVINVENACATASTAFQQACSMVTFGAYDVVLAFGVEKLYHADKLRSFAVFSGCVDVENPEAVTNFLVGDLSSVDIDNKPARQRSLFMDVYARLARDYMAIGGATANDFAAVSAKNSVHGSLNPAAQYRSVVSQQEVLASESIAPPLTLLMCSPLGDGASAAVIMSPGAAARIGARKPIRVLSSLIVSGQDRAPHAPSIARIAALRAYEQAAISPQELDCIELHDATSPAEMITYEDLGICAMGEGPALVADGATSLGGRLPVNTSGGLVRKGHPIGATGLAQVYELVTQLRGEAGARQVDGARLALAENGGGFLGADAAAMAMTVLAL
jgi:acetyl-CoA acetyltransferase